MMTDERVGAYERVGAHKMHDAAFQLVTDNPERAGQLLREQVPVLDRFIVLDSLTPNDSTLVDETLGQNQTDRLFDAKFRDGREGFVRLLLEHKSTPDSELPVQLMRYRSLIWSNRDKTKWPNPRRLPPIVCIVLYNGEAPWNVPQTVDEMIDVSADEFETLRQMGYFVIDLARLPFERLSKGLDLQAGLGAMKLACTTHGAAVLLEKVLQVLERMQNDWSRRQLAYYILHLPKIGMRTVRAAIAARHLAKVRKDMDTIAAQLMQEGRDEGRAEGRAEGRDEGRDEGRAEGRDEGMTLGRAEMLLEQLELRFGTVPPDVAARVRGAAEADLKRWSLAIFGARMIQEVFTD